jgi:hypothetical protein
MRIIRQPILIFSLLTGLFIILPATVTYAAVCSATRFVIEDEISGEELGVIFTESPTTAKLNGEVCLKGIYNDVRYQYLYKCDKTNRFDFIKKLKVFRNECKWGDIH